MLGVMPGDVMCCVRASFVWGDFCVGNFVCGVLRHQKGVVTSPQIKVAGSLLFIWTYIKTKTPTVRRAKFQLTLHLVR